MVRGTSLMCRLCRRKLPLCAFKPQDQVNYRRCRSCATRNEKTRLLNRLMCNARSDHGFRGTYVNRRSVMGLLRLGATCIISGRGRPLVLAPIDTAVPLSVTNMMLVHKSNALLPRAPHVTQKARALLEASQRAATLQI